jgi:hypothetical protein
MICTWKPFTCILRHLLHVLTNIALFQLVYIHAGHSIDLEKVHIFQMLVARDMHVVEKL